MSPPRPSLAFLTRQIRWAAGRGLPVQAAEDVVHEAYMKAAETFDPSRGEFDGFMHLLVRRACAQWWRQRAIRDRAHRQLVLVQWDHDTHELEVSALKQRALLGSLSDDERRVFAAWAIQKHLGRVRFSSKDAGRSLGLDEREFTNAKRRVKDKLWRLLERFGWTASGVVSGSESIDEIA